MLSWKNAPIRAKDGYWWQEEQLLKVAEERDLFALLGMGFVEPGDRCEAVYQKLLTTNWPAYERFYLTSSPAPLHEARGEVQVLLPERETSRYGMLPSSHFLRRSFESHPAAEAASMRRRFQMLQAESAVAEYNQLVQACRAEVAVLDRPLNLDRYVQPEIRQRAMSKRAVALKMKQNRLADLEMKLRAWEVRLEEVR